MLKMNKNNIEFFLRELFPSLSIHSFFFHSAFTLLMREIWPFWEWAMEKAEKVFRHFEAMNFKSLTSSISPYFFIFHFFYLSKI